MTDNEYISTWRGRRGFAGTIFMSALLASCGSEPSLPPFTDNLQSLAANGVIESSPASTPTPSPRLTREQLREKAKTDPDGADAEAIDGMSRNELMATAINSAGFLCARVTDMYPRGADIIAKCVEYRSGKGRVSYRVNAEAGSVKQID